MISIQRNFYQLEIESHVDFHSVHGCSDFIVMLHCKPLTKQEAVFLDRLDSLVGFLDRFTRLETLTNSPMKCENFWTVLDNCPAETYIRKRFEQFCDSWFRSTTLSCHQKNKTKTSFHKVILVVVKMK